MHTRHPARQSPLFWGPCHCKTQPKPNQDTAGVPGHWAGSVTVRIVEAGREGHKRPLGRQILAWVSPLTHFRLARSLRLTTVAAYTPPS